MIYLVGIGFLSISRRTEYAKFLLTKASDGDRNVKVFAISVV